MKIYFLGTNGWYDTDCGNTICTLIVTKKYNLILDAGNGIYKADKYINKNNPVYLFLSHFHIDHIEGLHILEKFSNSFKSLTIFGQPGTRKIINDFLGSKFSVPLSRLKFKSKIIELKQGFHNIPFKIRCLKLLHSASCYGYRIEVDGKVISYCTDTGYCKNMIELSKNADLLISECAFMFGQTNPNWPHLNPELAARIAVESGTKKLALTHFDADIYRTMGQRMRAGTNAKRIMKNAFIAIDNKKLIV